ncbi:Gfo/Idh/MocA family oxidoreductase [Arthrobacter sp. H35-D1]|nr:Gfo/Idh/MocA family oxidoreductase [Arthrobacter sp. H35-D1]MDJ0313869.1 Gfo/Idh/MocA family oxidoreductase [Arthrobacter sp. H35-D1]
MWPTVAVLQGQGQQWRRLAVATLSLQPTPVVGWWTVPRSPEPKEHSVKQLRIGLIGAGGIAGVHIAGWQQLGAHVSVFSRSGAAGLVEQYGIEEVDSVEALLEASDMVAILTPTPSHHGYAMAAFAAGKDVICEKPLADTFEHAAEMVNAARSAGLRLFPAHVVRFFPDYVAAKAQLDKGVVGVPTTLELSRAGAAPAAGSWFFDEAQGGGIVRDQMIHDLDQARLLAGEVTEVFAEQNPPSVDGILPRPVTARVVLTHANGATSQVRGEWGPDGLPFGTNLSVKGPRGTISFASPGSDKNEPDVVDSPYTRQNAEFAAARASGDPSRVSPSDGVVAVALAEAAAESIRCGKAVDFSAEAVLALLDPEHAG